jgi:hypothetical protein
MAVIISEFVDATAGSATITTAIESVGSAANTQMLIQQIGSRIRFIRYDVS